MPHPISTIRCTSLTFLFCISITAPALAEEEYASMLANAVDTATDAISSAQGDTDDSSDTSGSSDGSANTAEASSATSNKVSTDNSIVLPAQPASTQAANSESTELHRHHDRREFHDQHGWQRQAYNSQAQPSQRYDDEGYTRNQRAQTNHEFRRPDPRWAQQRAQYGKLALNRNVRRSH